MTRRNGNHEKALDVLRQRGAAIGFVPALDEPRLVEALAWMPTAMTLAELLEDPAVTAEQRLVVSTPPVAEGETALLSAPPKAGKSTLVSQIAADKSAGRAGLDGDPQAAGDVLWLGVDEHVRRLVPRLDAMGADPHRLRIVRREPGNVLKARHLKALIEQYNPVLVVLDTTSQLALDSGVNPNAGEEVGPFLRPLVDTISEANLARLGAGRPGCAGFFIHHAPHHASRAAGSLQWEAIVDASLVLRRKRRRLDPTEDESDDEEHEATAGDDGTRILEGVTRSGGPMRLRLSFAGGRYSLAGAPIPLIERVRVLLLSGETGPGRSSANALRPRLGCQTGALHAVLLELEQRGEVRAVGARNSPTRHFLPTASMTLYVQKGVLLPADTPPSVFAGRSTENTTGVRAQGRTGEKSREELHTPTSAPEHGYPRVVGKKSDEADQQYLIDERAALTEGL